MYPDFLADLDANVKKAEKIKFKRIAIAGYNTYDWIGEGDSGHLAIRANGPTGDASFEDKLKHFMQESDSRMADNKFYADHRTRRRSR